MPKNIPKLLQTVKIRPFKVDLFFEKIWSSPPKTKDKNQITCLTLNAWFFTVTDPILMIQDAF